MRRILPALLLAFVGAACPALAQDAVTVTSPSNYDSQGDYYFQGTFSPNQTITITAGAPSPPWYGIQISANLSPPYRSFILGGPSGTVSFDVITPNNNTGAPGWIPLYIRAITESGLVTSPWQTYWFRVSSN